MRTGLFIICISLLLSGCKNKNKVPAGIIPQKKMQAVLWDMMRADQFLGDFVLSKDSALDKESERRRLYENVFAIHQINMEKFRKSFSFYKSHPALFKLIMDSISQPKKIIPVDLSEPSVAPDSTRRSPQKSKDSFIQFRKKKVIPIN